MSTYHRFSVLSYPLASIIVLGLAHALCQAQGLDLPTIDNTPWQPFPYSPSETLAGIAFDLSTRETHAPGSDIWPITWADDGHQYTAWGDGAGFGGERNSDAAAGRVSMGVARIEGSTDAYRGVNVWGGVDAEMPAQFEGKATGILSVDGVLYMMVSTIGSKVAGEARPAVSTDHGRTWTVADWRWTIGDRVTTGVFLNFGRDYAGARDDYVYVYFTRVESLAPGGEPRNWIHERPGRVDLARVPKDRILDQHAYAWFAGVGENHAPKWTDDMAARESAFDDPNGIKVVSVCHNGALDRYLLLYNPKNNAGNFALFEAPEPWGPWHSVAYLKEQTIFMPPKPNQRVSIFHFAPKWWSPDGREFTLVFNVGDDQWNTVRGSLELR